MEYLNKCFEKYSFEELNSIDVQMLRKVLNFVLIKCPWKGEPFFDIGCNAGSFVRVLDDEIPYATVYCFEPHPVLSKKVKENYPKVKMHDICLSNKNEKVTLHIPMWSCGISSLINRPVFSLLQSEGQKIIKYEVDSLTIDSFCHIHSISSIYFMKIDVEGAEKMVLDGAFGMLKAKKVRAGVFEHGSTLTDAGTSADEICSMLQSFGYTIYKDFSENDYVFILEDSN